MKDLKRTTSTAERLASVLTAACCLYTAGMAQASEADVHTSANGGVTLQASQSVDAATAPAARAEASTDMQVSAGVRQKGAKASAEAVPAADADLTETASASAAGREIGGPTELTVPETRRAGDGAAASEATAMVTGASDSALNAAVDSATQSEIAASIESSVQGDIQGAVENDLVTTVTDSLPLP